MAEDTEKLKVRNLTPCNLHKMVMIADNTTPGTQGEIIQPLERTVEYLGMTSFVLNQFRGLGCQDQFAVERNQVEDQEQTQ